MRDGLTESTIRAHTESVPSRGIHQLAFRFPTLLHEKTDGRTHLITETQKMVEPLDGSTDGRRPLLNNEVLHSDAPSYVELIRRESELSPQYYHIT